MSFQIRDKKVDMLEKFLEKYNLAEKFREFLKPSPIRFIKEYRENCNDVEKRVPQKNSEIGR